MFSAPPNRITASQLSWLLAAPYLGAIFGAPILGRVADRYGRRRTLGAVLLWLGCMSVAVGAATRFDTLLIFRVLSGVSLGAWPPLAIAYLTDVLPPRRRGTLIMIVIAVSALGPPAGIFSVRALTPLNPLGYEGWQWVFILVALGSACCGLLCFLLPESPSWQAAVGRADAAAATALRFVRSPVVWRGAAKLPRQSDYSRRPTTSETMSTTPVWSQYSARLILVATLFFLSPWSTVAFPLLSGRILQSKGLALSDTLLNLAVATIGTVGGTLLAAVLIDRLERRIFVVGCAVLMAAGAIVFALGESHALLMAANFFFSVITAGFIPSLSIYAAELFPVAMRSFATSSTWSASRLAAVLAPIVLIELLQTRGQFAVVGVIVVSLITVVLSLFLFGPPGSAGKSVG